MTDSWFLESKQAKAPCKGCEHRKVGCHDCCKAYNDFKIRLAQIKQATSKRKLLERL